MPIFLLKTIFAVIMLFLTGVAMFTMFEILARPEKKYNIQRLKDLHRVNGFVYILFYLVTAFFCLQFIGDTKTELSSRAAFHGVLALAIITALGFKIAFIEIYKQFYKKVAAIGLSIAFMTFLLFGMSGGYYLLVTDLGTDLRFGKVMEEKPAAGPQNMEQIQVSTDPDKIRAGKALFAKQCASCHSADSTRTILGPGLKGVLKREKLPVSGRPATPENIARQLRAPFDKMPSFKHLSGEQVKDAIAYLNTL